MHTKRLKICPNWTRRTCVREKLHLLIFDLYRFLIHRFNSVLSSTFSACTRAYVLCTFIIAEARMVSIPMKYSIEWDPVADCENCGSDRSFDTRRISVWLHSSVSVGDYEKLEIEKTKSLRGSRAVDTSLFLSLNNKLPLSTVGIGVSFS